MRSISRRDFIVASGAVAAAGMLPGCGGGGGLGAIDDGVSGQVAALSRDHFNTLVGMPFLFEDADGRPHWLDLTAVHDQTDVADYPPEVEFRDPFVLVFHADEKETALEEGVYSIMHPEFDAFDLHVIPRMPDEDGARYDIVFT